MSISNRVTTLKNGLLTVKIAADGTVSSITMPNGDAVINASNTSTTGERGYFSYVSGELGTAELKATNVRVVTETDDMAEVVYYNNSNAQQWNVGYIMRKDVCGLYVYFCLSGVSRSGATDAELEEARMV
jgi:rhamnogalacturonan endolyase